jgi:ATP-dependent Clp protease ATP-binding subunit ClpC
MHPFFDKLTDSARKVLQLANEEARRRKNFVVNTNHILWALLQEPDTIAGQILFNLKIDFVALKKQVEEVMPKEQYHDHGSLVPYSQDAVKCILRSIESMIQTEKKSIGTFSLLLGILATDEAKIPGVTTELVLKEIKTIVA